MAELTYSNLALGWAPEHKQDSFFNRLTIITVVIALVSGLIVTSINLPKEEKRIKRAIPERVANFIMQKEKPKVIKPKPKPKPKPVPKIIKRIKKQAKIDKPLTTGSAQNNIFDVFPASVKEIPPI